MSAACLVVLLASWCVSCAAVEKQAATTVVESGPIKSLAAIVGSLLGRVAARAEEGLARNSALWTLKGEQRVLFRAFEAARPRVRWKVVNGDVKAFVRAFEAGAREPERYFKDPLADSALVARWNATPNSPW